MKKSIVDIKFGREAFGGDPAGYHAARPAYPDWVFEMLVDRGCLANGAATFEIGAGTGIATRRLIDLGASPLVIIEPDNRLAEFLGNTMPKNEVSILPVPFEEAELPDNSFDFGFSATAFHWLDEDISLRKVARLLRPGGWWGMVWNVFGNPSRHDPFHDATKELLEGLASPADGTGNIPFALDVESRLAALNRTEAFQSIEYTVSEWPLVLNARQTVSLYATFSNINIRPDRDSVLAALERIGKVQFGDSITRNMATCLYIAQRKN